MNFSPIVISSSSSLSGTMNPSLTFLSDRNSLFFCLSLDVGTVTQCSGSLVPRGIVMCAIQRAEQRARLEVKANIRKNRLPCSASSGSSPNPYVKGAGRKHIACSDPVPCGSGDRKNDPCQAVGSPVVPVWVENP